MDRELKPRRFNLNREVASGDSSTKNNNNSNTYRSTSGSNGGSSSSSSSSSISYNSSFGSCRCRRCYLLPPRLSSQLVACFST